MTKRRRRHRAPKKSKIRRKAGKALFFAGCGYALYHGFRSTYDSKLSAAKLEWAKSKVASDKLDQLASSCKSKETSTCGILKDAQDLRDNFQGILKAHAVPLSEECVEVPKTYSKPVKVTCLPRIGDNLDLQSKVSEWSAKLSSKSSTVQFLSLGSIKSSIETESRSKEYDALLAGRTKTLSLGVVSALSLFTALYVGYFIVKRIKQALPGLLKRQERKRIEPKKKVERKKSIDQTPSEEIQVVKSTPEEPTIDIPKIKKKKKSRADLIGTLDAILYRKFELRGLAAAIGQFMSRKQLQKYIREPRSLYYWVKENRQTVEAVHFDPDELMDILRNKPSGEYVAVAQPTKTPSSEINYEEVLGVVQFENGTRSDFDKLDRGLRKSLLRALWKYRMESGVARTYSGLKGLLGLNFAKSCRVLFHESNGNINILLIATDHTVYERWLDNARQGRVPALKLAFQ
jgi:hypothetical protein